MKKLANDCLSTFYKYIDDNETSLLTNDYRLSLSVL